MLTRQFLRSVAALWIVCLVAISLQPWRPPGESRSVGHPIFHVLAFGAAAVMLFVLSRNGKQISTAALGVFCLVLAIETGQHLLYKNPFEWWDVRDDTIGIALAWMLNRWTGIRSRLLSADR